MSQAWLYFFAGVGVAFLAMAVVFATFTVFWFWSALAENKRNWRNRQVLPDLYP